MSELVKIREKVFQEKFKGRSSKEVLEKTIENIKSNVKKPNKYDWNSFISSLECK